MERFFAKRPNLIMLEVTQKCNLNCDYCFKSKFPSDSGEMEWDVFELISRKLDSFEYVTFCGMGEQLLHKHFYEMAAYLENKKLYIITNGTVLIDYERFMEKKNVRNIIFSVDGPNEAIARKSCVKYNFDNLLRNFETGTKYPDMARSINFVISSNNLENALDMFDFCGEHGVNVLSFILPFHNSYWIRKNRQSISKMLEEARKLSIEKNILFNDPFSAYCISQENMAIPYISINGSVRTCCETTNRIPLTGNILEATYDEIWESENYRKFRSGFYCSDCKMVYNNKKVLG